MKRLLVVLVVVSLCPQRTRGQLPGDQLQRIDRAVATQMDAQGIPGVSLAVLEGGRVVLEKGYGLADVENAVAVTAGTRFRTASIAKPMTAVAVMQLAEADQLDLDAPIRKYVPEWPEKHATLTCRQLLSHTAGVRHYKFRGEAAGTRPFFDLVSTLELFADDRLKSKPGTAYHYTTYGFTLLGLAVERASGMTFDSYLEEHLWEKAGMDRSALDNHFVILKDRARGYQKLDRATWGSFPESVKKRVRPGQVLNAHLHDTSMKIPGGGLVSTAGDLCRFAHGMMTSTLVKPTTRDAMFTAQETADGKTVPYGLGWQVGKADGRRRIAHSGGQAGTACFLAFYPETGLAVAVMTNLRGADTRAIVRQVTRIVR